MDIFLNSIGWWNFLGSIIMLGFLNEEFGHKMLNKWTRIFVLRFKLNYWSKLWLFWAAGINIFFGLINIKGAQWDFMELKLFLIYSDICAYVVFILLVIWGIQAKKLGSGVASVLIIFLFWISWAVFVLYKG